jgi:uracil-DNA glycosylase
VHDIPPFPAAWHSSLTPLGGPLAVDAVLPVLRASYQSGTTFPPASCVWRALECCPPDEVKVVILGQDPYHGPGQADGLAFSVPEGQSLPPSLRNIFKELSADLGARPPAQGDLTAWAKQGVLLLNTSLTVLAGAPGSHADGRWDPLISAILAYLNAQNRPIAFWLWGAHAQQRGRTLSNSNHLVIRSAHPSPLGAYRGFWGSKPFSTTAEWFKTHGVASPKWTTDQPTFEG